MSRQEMSSDRSIVALASAALLVIVVVMLVLLFGIAHPPELVDLADQPEPHPPARVAWTTFEDDQSCVDVAQTDGTVERLWCGRAGGEVRAWPAAGIELWGGALGTERMLIDPETGEPVERENLDEPVDRSPPQIMGVWSRFDGTLTVTRDDTDSVVWEVDAPEGYSIRQGSLSPDGDWVALVDSVDRLLVVPADGSTDPRVWAEDAMTWQFPVWEGSETDGA